MVLQPRRVSQYPHQRWPVSSSIPQYPAVSCSIPVSGVGPRAMHCTAAAVARPAAGCEAAARWGGIEPIEQRGQAKTAVKCVPAPCRRNGVNACARAGGWEGGNGTRWAKTAEAPVLELRESVVAVHWYWCCVERKTHFGEASRPTLSAARWSRPAAHAQESY